jgi:hypothetical protein
MIEPDYTPQDEWDEFWRGYMREYRLTYRPSPAQVANARRLNAVAARLYRARQKERALKLAIRQLREVPEPGRFAPHLGAHRFRMLENVVGHPTLTGGKYIGCEKCGKDRRGNGPPIFEMPPTPRQRLAEWKARRPKPPAGTPLHHRREWYRRGEQS